MIKPFLRRVLPILLAAGLLWYVLKDVPLPEMAGQFQKANYGWLSLVGLLLGLFYIIRAARWRLTLQAMGYAPSLFRTTIALLAGTLASMIAPGAGELTRCGSLQRMDDVPVSKSLGSVVAERIIDLLMLILVLLLTVILEFRRVQIYLRDLTPAIPSSLMIVTGFVIAVAVAVLGWRILHSVALREHPFAIKITGLFQGFKQGFMAIRKLPNPGLFIAYTLSNQVLAWLANYILLLAAEDTQNLSPKAALTILAVSSLGGLAVPTQGGIGTYHFLVSRALLLYGFTVTQGAIVATFLHAVGFGINLLLSSVSFLILPLLITRKTRSQPQRTV